MSGTNWMRCGAILGGLGVVFGAFGAHGLEGKLSARNLNVFEVAARYQMYHAGALIAVGLLATIGRSGVALKLAGWCLLLGTLTFSGALYALALSDEKRLGMVAPIGGLAQIVGWFALAVAAGSARKPTGVEARGSEMAGGSGRESPWAG